MSNEFILIDNRACRKDKVDSFSCYNRKEEDCSGEYHDVFYIDIVFTDSTHMVLSYTSKTERDTEFRNIFNEMNK